MKKLFVVLSLVLGTSFVAFAQRPVAGAKGFTFGLNAPFNILTTESFNSGPAATGTLLFRYYLADDMAARVSINYAKSGSTTTDTSSTNGNETVDKTSTSRFAIQLGIQKSLGEGEKLEPYVGADLMFAKTGGKSSSRTETVNASGGGTVGNFSETERNGYEIFDPTTGVSLGYQTPGMQFGLIPVVGFNYYFTENFAIGAEFGWGFVLQNNNKSLETVTNSKVGTTTTTTTTYTQDQVKSTTIGSQGNGQLTVSVFF